jgi:hypothetical protein
LLTHPPQIVLAKQQREKFTGELLVRGGSVATVNAASL